MLESLERGCSRSYLRLFERALPGSMEARSLSRLVAALLPIATANVVALMLAEACLTLCALAIEAGLHGGSGGCAKASERARRLGWEAARKASSRAGAFLEAAGRRAGARKAGSLALSWPLKPLAFLALAPAIILSRAGFLLSRKAIARPQELREAGICPWSARLVRALFSEGARAEQAWIGISSGLGRREQGPLPAAAWSGSARFMAGWAGSLLLILGRLARACRAGREESESLERAGRKLIGLDVFGARMELRSEGGAGGRMGAIEKEALDRAIASRQASEMVAAIGQAKGRRKARGL